MMKREMPSPIFSEKYTHTQIQMSSSAVVISTLWVNNKAVIIASLQHIKRKDKRYIVKRSRSQ